MTDYADVILPLAVQGTFTYLVPEEMQTSLQRGSRVYVPFGTRKRYTGIVADLHTNTPAFTVKPIISMLDAQGILRHPQLKFWKWLSEYYLCTLGEVYKAAVPTGLKVESETVLSLNAAADLEELGPTLSPAETGVLDDIIAHDHVRLTELDHDRPAASVARYVSKLLQKGLVVADEKATSTYKPKRVAVVSLGGDIRDNDWLHHAFDAVSGAPKQERLLIAFLEMVKSQPLAEVSRDDLLGKAHVSTAILKALRDKGIL
ncbi:MAG: primosomal protein N', partial [Lepagella sp.]